MKPTAFLLTMFGLAAAQKMSDAVPECAVSCLEKGIASATSCSVDDSACLCEVDNYRNTYDAAQACVLQACGASKSLEEVLPAAAAFCSDVTGGATAPPVDDSAASTGTGNAATTGAASGTSAAASGTGAAEVTTTAKPDGAAQMGSIGGLGMLALGLLAL